MTNPVPVPTSVYEFVQQQLDKHLRALEVAFDADALCIVGPLVSTVDNFIRVLIEEFKQREEVRSSLVVLLTTNGGQIETVSRIADTFRHHYKQISYVIPDYAFSAGTVLAMSGDAIYMDYYSRLGPIDPQIPGPNGRLVPALGYLIQWERLLEKAREDKLTLAEIQLMIDGFDQAELYQYEQARELSVALLQEWLVQYKFKNWTRTETRNEVVTPEMKKSRAETIARRLSDTDKWHSHGNGISLSVLQNDLQLRIDDLDLDINRERHDIVRQYDALLSDYMEKRGHSTALCAVGRYLHFWRN